ncbi:MAG: transposase [Deltaproteobacteria bacterium]|nr:transposase [Deltaproteobacteria bacterium]
MRPWITAWEDKRSRLIAGHHTNSGPNQTTIMIAMKRAIERYGPPEGAKIDNGRDYDSQMFTGTTKARRKAIKKGYLDEMLVAGIYAMMDIAVSFSIPYHHQSKPIERWFDTLDRQFTKTLPTYCGKDSNRKPENLNDYLASDRALAEAYDLESFARLVDEYIAKVYNASPHTGVGMNGQSPAAVMATRTTRRVITDGLLDLLMRVWSGELMVGKNGVRFKNIWYGQFNAELLCHQGRKVRVAYDPDDLRQVWVYDAATMKLIAIADQNQLIAYGSAVSDDSLRVAMQQKNRAKKIANKFRDASLTANMDLTALALKAQQEGLDQADKKTTAPAATIRPVATPFDSQVAAHDRLGIGRVIKRAAGAEGTDHTQLDMDLSTLRPTREPDVNLFDE